MARHLIVPLLALVVAASAAGAGGANGAGELTFYPQAGILWRDLYPTNFVDLDPGPGVRDFACGTQTYDGHTGTDSDIRSFREMDIGVPVFAALDGRVISVQDGEFDRNHGQTAHASTTTSSSSTRRAASRSTGTCARGFGCSETTESSRAAARLDGVERELELAAPHFTSQVASQIHEPFSGSCNEGPSGWTEQVPTPTEPYVRDLALSAKPMTGKRDLPYDRAVRAGTFVRGTKVVYSRVELGAMLVRRIAADSLPPAERIDRCRVDDDSPDGARSRLLEPRIACRFRTGCWRIVVELDGGRSADTTLDVVATASEVRNRPPNAISVGLRPASLDGW